MNEHRFVGNHFASSYTFNFDVNLHVGSFECALYTSRETERIKGDLVRRREDPE